MRLANIIRAVRFEPWCITPSAYAVIAQLVANASTGKLRADDGEFDDFMNTRPEMVIDPNGNATIHVFGTLLAKSTPIERTCGNTDYAQIRADLARAKSAGATSATLVIDSPGGMVQGVRETAAAILNAGIPVDAMVDGDCCSAAYWLASQCVEIAATPSSTIGSIGVIMPWIDQVGMWEQLGIGWNPITNDGADLKGAGNGPELTEAQREFLTAGANTVAGDFWDAIESRRGPMPEVLRRAGWYGTQDAYNLKLIDRIL